MWTLKRLDQVPPGGNGEWYFYQPETRWTGRSVDFTALVRLVRDHRLGNPRFGLATEEPAIEAEIIDSYCLRLHNDPNWCVEKKTAVTATPPVPASAPTPVASSPPPPPKKSGAGLVDKVAATVSGAKLLVEWLGDGGTPVSVPLATARAGICGNCPLNNLTPEATSKLKKRIGAAIKRHVALKQKLELTVPNEAALGICDACSCVLPLKVWVPLRVIAENTTSKQLAKFADGCWIKNEIEEKSYSPSGSLVSAQ
jgi:hypothetical protein